MVENEDSTVNIDMIYVLEVDRYEAYELSICY